MPLVYPTVFFSLGGTTGFPVIRGTSANSTNTFDTSHAIDLPAGVQAGDLLIVDYTAAAVDALDTVTLNVPGGWTSLDYHTQFIFNRRRVIWRIASAAHTSVTVTTGNSSTYSANCYAFSQYSKTPAMTPFPNFATTANPDSAPLSVPADWGGAPHCCFISSVYKGGAGYSIDALPSGYGDLLGTTAAFSTRSFSARRNVQAATEDPGAWATSASTGAVPVTIAVRGPE